MKTKSILIIAMLFCVVIARGQKTLIDLTFTAIDNTAYIQLDSIKVMNRTQGDSANLYWPDTTLAIEITPGELLLFIGYSTGNAVEVQEVNEDENQFQLFQNFPNPVKDQGIISLYIPEKGTVNIIVTDIQGRIVKAIDWQLVKGHHSFSFTPGALSLSILTARWKGIDRSIKIISTGSNSGNSCTMNYLGSADNKNMLKASAFKASLVKLESGILDSPTTNESYTFQFATNIPCPGTPTVTYEGQVYNTIQICSQCWMKENLNAGNMIPGTQGMSNNSVIEKYCYINELDSCTKYGGLYQWDEMMQYTITQGVQGICPPGWHLPTDEEWKVMEGVADTQYGIGDNIWENLDYRGFNAGANLKAMSGWYENANGTDLFDYSGLPGGRRGSNGFFGNISEYGIYWTSTEFFSGFAWYRTLSYETPEVQKYYYNEDLGYSVRCIKDY